MSRLVVVSNRVAPIEEGKGSSGGLSVAVEEALQEIGGVWFGWNGKVQNLTSSKVRTETSGNIVRATIALARRDYDQYYKGYSNTTLWPLFHYRLHLVGYAKEDAAGYLRVNQMFAGKLSNILKKDDLVWVHDYHLMILGRELRRMGFENRMGFFLHTPFPPPDVLMSCTDHEAIVRALFDFDVIGFQTEIDVRNLHEYVRRRGDGRVRGRRVEAFGKSATVKAYPIGIHPDTMAEAAAKSAGSYQTRQLIRSLGDKNMIIGVDRLDYSKGLGKRFDAYEMLLAHYPENRGRVSFMQIAPPSRGDVQGYRQIREALEGQAGSINGRYADFDWIPLRYLNKSFPRDVLMGFFRVSRVGFVTPLRDGMNLVAKEYVAAQDPEDPGVLVLSQFAGASLELTGAVIVNPYDVEAMAEGLQAALMMKAPERRDRYKDMMKVMRRNNLGNWHRRFIGDLKGQA